MGESTRLPGSGPLQKKCAPPNAGKKLAKTACRGQVANKREKNAFGIQPIPRISMALLISVCVLFLLMWNGEKTDDALFGSN